MSSHNNILLAGLAFSLTLISPLVFPGFFPFDVNLILAIASTLLFFSCLLRVLKFLFVPKTLTIAVLSIIAIQMLLMTTGIISAPEVWRLHSIGYLTVAVMLIAGVSSPTASLRLWIQLYLFAAAVWSAIGLYVWLGGTGGLPLEVGPITVALAPALKLAGPFNQGNIFATAIGFAWLFAHWVYFRDKKFEYALAVLFFTAMLLDSLSKGGWLAFGLANIVLIIAQRVEPAFILKRFMPLWVAGILLGMVLLKFSQPRLASDAFLAITQADASLGFRLLIWASAVAEFLNSPWTGVGWGQFPTEFWKAAPQAQAWMAEQLGWHSNLYSHAMSAHNILLQVLAEAGIIALLLLLWGIWRLLRSGIALAANGNSPRLPFALASLAFLLQSQLNISYTQPVPLLMATFFAGIAVAPWVRKYSWKFKSLATVRSTSLAISIMALVWSAQLSQQWFSTEQAIRNFDMQNEQSIRKLADVAAIPRTGAIPLIWLGYNVAAKQEHLGLLTWILPYMRQSIHEVPFVDSYQVLFYALVYSQRLEEACQLGGVISRRNLPGEKNNLAYEEVCEGKTISHYEFGH